MTFSRDLRIRNADETKRCAQFPPIPALSSVRLPPPIEQTSSIFESTDFDQPKTT